MSDTSGSVRLLYVDSDRAVAERTARRLERADERFTVEMATSAADGLDSVTDTEIDCLVSAYRLPETTGVEFLEAVRAVDATLPFVLYPEAGSEEIASAAISAGVTEYVTQCGTDEVSALVAGIEGAISTGRTAGEDTAEEIERQEQVLREMYEATADQDRSFEAQVAALLDIGLAVLGLSYGVFSRVDDGAYTFEVVEAPEGWFEAGETVPLSATCCGETVASGRTRIVTDGAIHREPGAASDREITSYVGTPVVVDDAVYGTLCFYGTGPREEISEWAVTLIELMGRWVAYERQRTADTRKLATENERLDAFVSTISHDLRNPLSVAKARLELAREEVDSEHLDYVEHAHDRSQALIDDLLTLAREGDSATETGPVDLAETLERCWEIVETTGASLAVEDTETVRADRSRLRQLFENLVRNAIDHTDGEATIRAGLLSPIHTTTRVTDDSSPLGFYVADDGSGIPEHERDRLFERGYSNTDAGTGIGLAIVEAVVEAHGWTITITDSDAGGARFEITDVEFV